jgi:uncharacterized membrane protein
MMVMIFEKQCSHRINHCLEAINLSLEFSYQLHVSIFIHRRFIDDILGTISVPQSTERFSVVDVRG